MDAPLPPHDAAPADAPGDPARTPGPLAVSVLALLAEGAATATELHEQLVSRRQDRLVAWDQDALAEAISQAREQGWVMTTGAAPTDDGHAPAADPREAGAGGTARAALDASALELTDPGRQALADWTAAALAAHEPERPAFDLALLTAPAVPPDVAREALTHRLAELDIVTGQLTTRIRTASRRGLSEAYGMQADYRRALLMAEFRWLSRLLERMDSGELSWTAGEAPATTPEGV